jgi:hypothetical protein
VGESSAVELATEEMGKMGGFYKVDCTVGFRDVFLVLGSAFSFGFRNVFLMLWLHNLD